MGEYNAKKEKVFYNILSKCDDTVIARLENNDKYADAEEDSDVAALMGLIKESVVGTSDRIYPGIQAAQAWKTLNRLHQFEDEDVLLYYRRFRAAVEHVEKVSGVITPDVLSKNMRATDNKEGRSALLVCMFITGSNKMFDGYKKKLADDYADRKVSNYPDSLETALPIMQAYLNNHGGAVKKGNNFAQWDIIKEIVRKIMIQMSTMVPVRNQLIFGVIKSRRARFECANYHWMELAKECVGRVV